MTYYVNTMSKLIALLLQSGKRNREAVDKIKCNNANIHVGPTLKS